MRPFNHQSFALHVSVLLYYCFYLHLQGYKSADNFVILLVVNPVKILPSCMFNTCSGALKEGQCKWKEGNGEHGGDWPLLSEAWTDTRESSVKNWVVFLSFKSELCCRQPVNTFSCSYSCYKRQSCLLEDVKGNNAGSKRTILTILFSFFNSIFFLY